MAFCRECTTGTTCDICAAATYLYTTNDASACVLSCPDGLYGYDIDRTCITKDACNSLNRFIYLDSCI